MLLVRWSSGYRACCLVVAKWLSREHFRVRGNSSLRDDEAKERNLRSEETTLLRMGVKLLLSKCLKHLSEVLMMGVSGAAIDQYVVEVYYDELVDEWA